MIVEPMTMASPDELEERRWPALPPGRRAGRARRASRLSYRDSPRSVRPPRRTCPSMAGNWRVSSCGPSRATWTSAIGDPQLAERPTPTIPPDLVEALTLHGLAVSRIEQRAVRLRSLYASNHITG